MLTQFANLDSIDIDSSFFIEQPRTAFLKPSVSLPKSKFWPMNKVAFRICTIPEIAEQIIYPITATSANISGDDSIYSVKELKTIFGDEVGIYDKIEKLSIVTPSEILDFTGSDVVRVR